jgi:transcriptional regulator with XRE-family HTH domain
MSKQIKNPALQQAIAIRLKELRTEKGISQQDVYNDTEIHIARIETGNLNISTATLAALCGYFSISLHDFFATGFDQI